MIGQDKSRSLRPVAVFVLVLVLLLAVLAYIAPKYLAYADNPVKADAVVLIVGPDRFAREMEAKKLIEGGYAEYLLIPTIGVFEKNSSAIAKLGLRRDDAEKFSGPDSGISSLHSVASPANGGMRIQNTHLEILEAKRMMSQLGLKSALFVSSPGHMRRIKIIAENVFDKDRQYELTFVPTSFEKLPGDLWGLSKYADWAIVKEYLKISAFLAYSYIGM